MSLPGDDSTMVKIFHILSEDTDLASLFPQVNDLLLSMIDENFSDRQLVATVLSSNGVELMKSKRKNVFDILTSFLRIDNSSVR